MHFMCICWLQVYLFCDSWDSFAYKEAGPTNVCFNCSHETRVIGPQHADPANDEFTKWAPGNCFHPVNPISIIGYLKVVICEDSVQQQKQNVKMRAQISLHRILLINATDWNLTEWCDPINQHQTSVSINMDLHIRAVSQEEHDDLSMNSRCKPQKIGNFI